MNRASYMDVFHQRLRALLPPEALARVQQAWEQTPPTMFRLVGLQEHRHATERRLRADGFSLQSLPWCPDIRCVPAEQRSALTRHPCFLQGWVYILNPSSLLAVQALRAEPGEEVLDMCAAPGGKTLALADAMRHQGRLAAVEAVRARFFKLRALVRRHPAAPMIHCYHADARQLWRKTPARFDRLLLDAPCSSEARIRPREPDTWRYWSPNKSKEMQRKQRALIRSAFACLKPGGQMLYCTCTYAPEENEAIVQSLLDRHPEAEILPCSIDSPSWIPGLRAWRGERFHDSMRDAVRLLPDGRQDGFFLCRIAKRAEADRGQRRDR